MSKALVINMIMTAAAMEFAVKNYKEIPSSDGVAFHANILRNGAKVGEVSNGGYGGCTDFFFDDRGAEAAYKTFAKNLFGDDDFEVEDALAQILITRFELERKAKRNKSKALAVVTEHAPVGGFGNTFSIKGENKGVLDAVNSGKYKDAIVVNPIGEVSFFGNFASDYVRAEEAITV